MAIFLPQMVSPLYELGSCDRDHRIHIILAFLLIISFGSQDDQNNQLARLSISLFFIISLLYLIDHQKG